MPPVYTFTNLMIRANKMLSTHKLKHPKPHYRTLRQTVRDVSRKATQLSTPVHRNWKSHHHTSSPHAMQTAHFETVTIHFLSSKAEVHKPLYPFPFVTPMTSIISSGPNTWDTGTGFSRCSRAHWTFCSMVPPLSWISMMCAFFWRFFNSFI